MLTTVKYHKHNLKSMFGRYTSDFDTQHPRVTAGLSPSCAAIQTSESQAVIGAD